MTEHSEDARKRRMESARHRDRREDSQDRSSSEPVRRKDRREASRRRHMSGVMSCQPAEDMQMCEVMAGRHYPSRVPPDPSHTMEESRKLNEDRRQSPRTKERQCASMHSCHQQPTKGAIKRAWKQKFRSTSELEKRSSSEFSGEPERSDTTDMPPRKKRVVLPKPSPAKMGRKATAPGDQSLRGRLNRILSAKTDEFIWDTQKKMFREWAARVRTGALDLAAPLYHSGIAVYFAAPPNREIRQPERFSCKVCG